ncbi:3'(2'),5'-bisphosphate nucleotidase CysQ [Streptomyces phaeoluteigriseus]|uniref:3'(2'),5'-bisphosphate nucleotidase CysQ n=1 Tax=Streptomyces phaeoluteigriseus TaxID=114686 RepID=A0A1V6MV21_9ACTN|nr:inositol monophosphatase [Streptomyces phaeoluteigriseus]OQD56279.1 3'(2'),5'-bisphosphate nucleotidase CysQ [Streptomyces phaeoluteigriseus]
MSQDLLAATVAAVRQAGALMMTRYSTESRQPGLPELLADLQANDAAVVDTLRPALTEALPSAGWLNDEHGAGPMAAGEWWLIDPVGGNVNAVHGMPDWNIGVSLVRDGRPVLAAVYFPVLDEMFTATEGDGAFLNGVRLRASVKTSLDGALTGTGQAKPGHDPELARRMGSAFTEMMNSALYVRVSVPVTGQLAQVAAGRMDLHWQFDNVRSHAAGVLLVQEAGGIVTDLEGKAWELATGSYLAAAPGVHAAALEVLTS